MRLQNLKYEIENFLTPLIKGGVLLGFSGGTDSALLGAILAELSQKLELTLSPFLAIANSPLQNPTEIKAAQNLAHQLRIPYKVFELDTLSIEAVRNNHKDRCYHCKKLIFETFAAHAAQNGIAHIVDGTNADDTKVYRPGRRALAELGVISPFAILGITKQQIRDLSRAMNLCTWQKPATPCLATRFPYNTPLSEQHIAIVAAAEDFLRNYFSPQANIRVRMHNENGEKKASIELDRDLLFDAQNHFGELERCLKELGFTTVCLDNAAFVSGKFDLQPSVGT